MSRENIYVQAITIDWITKYLDNRLDDPLGFHKLLCMTHSDKPTHSKRYQALLYKLASTKATWDWMDDHGKQATLNRLAEEIAFQ